MGNDVVHLPAMPLQAGPGGPVFFPAGQLLFPPGTMIHSIKRTALIEPPAFLLKVWIVRLQDAAADIVATGAAHREEGLALDIVDLTLQQVNHRGSDPLYCAAVPLLCREFSQHIEVLMVARYEQSGEGLRFQPVPLLSVAVPDAAEVSGNDHAVVFGQFRLFVEDVFLEPGEISAGVAGDKNCHGSLLQFLS